MKKCINCGKLLDDGAKFCAECGLSDFTQVFNETPVPDNTETVRITRADSQNSGEFTYSPPSETKKKAKKTKRKKSKGKKFAVLVLGIVLIVGILSVRNLIIDKRDREERQLSAMREEMLHATEKQEIDEESAVEETATEEKTTVEKTTAEKTTAASTTKAPETTTKKTENETRDPKDIDPAFREMLEGYEAYFDQYIEFMQNYDASDFSMLSEYSKLMLKYAEWAEKIDDVDEDELTDAEMMLYLEVTSRVTGKLAAADY